MNGSNSNDDVDAALRYHEITKHSEEKLAGDPYFLDWSNRPQPFKLYRELESVILPADPATLVHGTPPALEAIALSGVDVPVKGRSESTLDISRLARVLYLSAGITKQKRYPGGEIYFRAYANTGGLYHIDLYVVTGDLPDLPGGVYQFGPHDFALHQLRAGDYRSVVAEATGSYPRITGAPAILISASTYWRNAWKYRERTYRHCFWDTGTLHANLIAIAAAEALQPMVVLGFVDSLVTELLGLDVEREGALTLIPIGKSISDSQPATPLPELSLETLPLSRSEIDYPLIREIHAASSIASAAEVSAWRGRPSELRPPTAVGEVYPLRPKPTTELPTVSLAEVIEKRGSTRASIAHVPSRTPPFRVSWTARHVVLLPTWGQRGQPSSISISS